MLRRVAVPLLLMLVLPGAAHAAATPRIKGGADIDISKAPWTVFISNATKTSSEPTGSRCTGVIINETTVWTAAHCVVDEDSGAKAAAADLHVYAALNDGAQAASANQDSAVAGYRAMPRFPSDKYDDVAVLKLTTALKFTTNVQPIAVAKTDPPPGTTIRITGYGIADPATSNTKLRQLDETVKNPWECASNATVLCSSTPTGTVCSGDSGGPAFTTGATPTLVGLTSRTDLSCPNGAIAYFAKVTAPELGLYLAGNDSPPLAPRKTTTDGGYRVLEIVGQTMTCDPGTVQNSPSYGADFIDATSGQVLQSGASLSYTFQPSDAGRRITCVIAASNAGGTLKLAPEATNAIQPLKPAAVGLTLTSTGFAITSSSDAPTLTLTTTDATGKVVRQAAFARGTNPARTKLPSGAYRTCVSSPQTTYFAAASTCVPEIVSGRASELVRRVKARHKGSRYVVTLAAAGPAIGKKVTVKWYIRRKGYKTRTKVTRVTLKSSGTLTSPGVPGRRTLSLQVILPSLKGSDGVPYSAARATLTIGTQRK